MQNTNIRIYAIIDPEHLFGHDIITLAKQLEAGGATIIQYRAKNTSTSTMILQARALKLALNIPLLINDRVDVALASLADGVHLGQEDMSPFDARAILGAKAIIGITIKEAAHIDNAPFPLINYGCIGGVFATASKDNKAKPLGLAGLTQLTSLWKSKSALPVGAIAGINTANAKSVMDCGVDGVAVISALSKGESPLQNTQTLKEAIS